MSKTAAVVSALGLFGVIGLTPAMAGSALNTDRSAEFKVAQSPETTGAATSKAKSKQGGQKTEANEETAIRAVELSRVTNGGRGALRGV